MLESVDISLIWVLYMVTFVIEFSEKKFISP